MLKKKMIIPFLVSVSTLFGQQYEVEWEKGFHNEAGAQTFNSITLAKDGNLVAVGSSVYGDRKDRNVYMAKVSPSGEIAWEVTHAVDEETDDYGQSCIELDNGNWLVGGYSEYRSFHMILNDAGVRVSDTILETNSIVNKYLRKENGEILALLADQYPGDDRDKSFALLFNFSAEGEYLSHHLLDNTVKLETVAGYDIEHYPGVGYLVAGAYSVRAVNYEFEKLWYRCYETPRNGHHTTFKMVGKITEMRSAKFGIAGYCGEEDFNPKFDENFDPWVATIDSIALVKPWDVVAESFTQKSSRKYNDYLRDIQWLTDTSYIVVGNHCQGDAYAAVVHVNGEILWDSNFEGPGGEGQRQKLLSVVTTGDGGFAVAGSYHEAGTEKTEELGWIQKYKVDGSSSINSSNIHNKQNSPSIKNSGSEIRIAGIGSRTCELHIYSLQGRLLRKISDVQNLVLDKAVFTDGVYLFLFFCAENRVIQNAIIPVHQ